MAVIPHAIGTIGVDYTPNADRQIEGSSRQPRRPGACERALSCGSCCATSSHRRVHQALIADSVNPVLSPNLWIPERTAESWKRQNRYPKFWRATASNAARQSTETNACFDLFRTIQAALWNSQNMRSGMCSEPRTRGGPRSPAMGGTEHLYP